ncbi:MAG: hypothetical protein WBA45_12215 [Microthrixaceae bacterium]
MLHTMWSPKAGVGLSVTAAATAAVFAKQDGSAVLVDLCGDQPALLGIADPNGPGVFDWLASDGASAESLGQLLVEGPSGVDLLPMGEAAMWLPGRVDDLLAALGDLRSEVVIDAGSVGLRGFEPTGSDVRSRISLVESLQSAGRSIVVTSSCYLALRRAIRMNQPADGLVVVSDPGRALNGRDIADLIGVPLVAQIDRDPAVARSVDAGLFLRRPSRGLGAALNGLAVQR